MLFWRNLWRAPARSLLTLLGVATGIALFVSVTAITSDARSQVAAAATAYGIEVVVYERRGTSPFSSRIMPSQMDALRARYREALTPIVLGTRNEPWNPYVLLIGVPTDFRQRIPLTEGVPYDTTRAEVMLGEVVAGQLRKHVGDTIPLGGVPFAVRGIFRTGSRLLDGGVMLHLPRSQEVLAREDGEPRPYSLAVLRAGSDSAATALMADVNGTFPRLRAIPGTEFAGAMRLMRVVDAFVRTLAVIALLATMLIVMNTLFMALGERTREIGILMAIGWRPPQVLRVLGAEALALCLAGALVGDVLALVLLRVVSGIEAIGFGWIPVRYPPMLALTSVALALLVALVALLWPAWVLWRLQPLAALRHE